MQKTELPVYSIGLFGDGIKHFWMGKFTGLIDRYPILGYPHRQDFYTILLVENALGEILVDSEKINLNFSAKAIIIKPGCILSLDLNKQAIGHIVCFTEQFFSLRYNNNMLHQFSYFRREARPYLRLHDKNKSRLDQLIELCHDEFGSDLGESETLLRSYLNIILFELERMYHPTGFQAHKNIKQEKIQQFEELINLHFYSKKLPSSYADLLFMSPNYLNKICKEETGQTAGDLIRRRVAIEAQRLLHYSSCTVNEIAHQLGFDNISYFVTYFKKQTGLTPEQFRKEKH
ncbi:helix-turn-helix domain-containing protein [Pedobacter sp. GR22-6]|uniref:helix-turn-helix domain-containing protein n=1 Tax=Pedobacter sp. GR22-6 TaxID=3127957 RepID=UPI00307F4624